MFLNTMRGMASILYFHFGNRRLCHTRFRKKPMHGSRFLTNKERAFDFNAWDDVQWDEAQENEARKRVDSNSVVKLTLPEVEKYDAHANEYWDAFYNLHTNRFFKDRHWLFTEFPELNSDVDCTNRTIFELGCGVGNTIFPILQYAKAPNTFVYGCDFSKQAIEILKSSPDYDSKRCNVFVLDVTSQNWLVPFKKNSLDIVVLIFVLSAIRPDRFKAVFEKLYHYLKPGGLVLFRDYGRYDLTQLRFKPGQCLAENFYVRGDGTRVYFFTKEEVDELLTAAGFLQQELHMDYRLQVNRGRMLKMYRVWVQARYKKPS